MRRSVAVGAAVAAAVAAAGGGWLAGRGIKSPDQAALEAEPPAASLITVDVELAELSADVITRADVGYDEPALLSLSGALGDRGSAKVVTSAPERGAELAEGSVAIEIAGRPVFVLVGPVPVYRDLRPRDRGPDVRQLEEALARLGHFDGRPDPLFDDATGDAVQAWYEAAGYGASGASDAERASLRAGRDRLDAASDALAAAREALAEALEGPTAMALRQARTEVASAQSALEGARLGAERAAEDAQQATASAQRAVADAELATASAERAVVDAELARQAAYRAVDDAQRGVDSARAAREQAAQNFDQAQLRWQSAQTGVHPDTGEVPSAAQHEALRHESVAAERSLADAQRAVGGAQRAVTGAQRAVGDAQRAVTGAQRAAVDAETEVERRRGAVPSPSEQSQAAGEAQLAVRRAEDRLAMARQSLNDLLEPPDTEDLSRRVTDARDEQEVAAGQLADLEASTGVWLPAGELIFLSRLPVRVDRLTVERGSTVSGSFMTVTGSELAVRGAVSERDVDRVAAGAEALIEDPRLEAPVSGTIRLVDPRAGTRGVAPDRHYLEVVAEGIPDDLVGRNVKIRIPVGGTDGAVLVVPAAALSATADGATRVEVEQPDATTRFVAVELGLSTGGRVEVAPLDGELQPGDRVVVGVAAGE